MNRLLFLLFVLMAAVGCSTDSYIIMTVNGPVPASEAGTFLTHEHVLVDFAGADTIAYEKWDREKVIEKALPFLKLAQEYGCKTFVECTPSFIGKDPLLLKSLSERTGMNILTNTGFYGASNDKYIPSFVYDESVQQIASRWISEWNNGIDGSQVKPGFIKIGVAPGSLSDLHRKLITAAAITHLNTGMVIASHTGPGQPAFEQIEILKTEGVSPEAFIWVHAQTERDLAMHVKAARMGSWVSFDGLSDENVDRYVELIKNMDENRVLNRVLLSHDAGWYDPQKEDGGKFRGYDTLFEKLLPALQKEGFTHNQIQLLLVKNPAEAFAIKIRNLE